MMESLKASWDHLPKKPRLPPSLFSLRSRKLWLNVKPEFSYGDERDKIQHVNARKAKKELARDEAWALREKKRLEKEKERERKKAERQAKIDELKKARAAGIKTGAGAKPTTTRKVPVRAATMPARTTSPRVAAAKPKVVYAHVPAPAVAAKPVQRSRTMPPPKARPVPTPSRQASAPVPVRRVAAQPAVTRKPTVQQQRPTVVRSRTMPAQQSPRRK